MCKRSDTIFTLLYSNFADFVDWERRKKKRGENLLFNFFSGKKFVLEFSNRLSDDFDVLLENENNNTKINNDDQA